MSKLRQCWQYWHENIEIAKGRFDLAALIATAVLAWLSVLCALVNLPNPIAGIIANSKISAWSAISAPTIFSLWCFLWLPFKRHKAEQVKYDSAKLAAEQEHGKEKQKLTSEIGRLTSEVIALEIHFINPETRDAQLYRWVFRVKVSNKHPKNNAKGVRVWLKEIQCEKWKTERKPLILDKMAWPHQLPEMRSQDNFQMHDIPPKPFEKLFDVLMVKHSLDANEIAIAPFEPPTPQHTLGRSKVAEFTAVDFDDPKGLFTVTIQVTGGDGVVTVEKSATLSIVPHTIENFQPPPPRWEFP